MRPVCACACKRILFVQCFMTCLPRKFSRFEILVLRTNVHSYFLLCDTVLAVVVYPGWADQWIIQVVLEFREMAKLPSLSTSHCHVSDASTMATKSGISAFPSNSWDVIACDHSGSRERLQLLTLETCHPTKHQERYPTPCRLTMNFRPWKSMCSKRVARGTCMERPHARAVWRWACLHIHPFPFDEFNVRCPCCNSCCGWALLRKGWDFMKWPPTFL